MMTDKEIRIDKFLWAVRIYKTRSLATDACKKGKIIIDNIEVKPSRIIKGGEIIMVKKMPVIYTYKVKSILVNRVAAKLVQEYIDDLTSEEELLKLKLQPSGFFIRDRGTGRPTKKERRTIDKIQDDDF